MSRRWDQDIADEDDLTFVEYMLTVLATIGVTLVLIWAVIVRLPWMWH